MTSSGAPRLAVVTGISNGIGAATARRLNSDGMQILGIDRLSTDAFPVIMQDLSESDAIDDLVARIATEAGAVDVLVNCAGIAANMATEDMDYDAFRYVQRVNLDSPVMLMCRLGDRMAERGYGRIVNVTSIHGRISRPGALPYAVSKAGLEAATRTRAAELARRGVLVNAVAPGLVATSMNDVDGEDRFQTEQFRQNFIDNGRLPIGRVAEVDEIAAVISYLVSAANTYVTGQSIAVDGGFTARF